MFLYLVSLIYLPDFFQILKFVLSLIRDIKYIKADNNFKITNAFSLRVSISVFAF